MPLKYEVVDAGGGVDLYIYLPDGISASDVELAFDLEQAGHVLVTLDKADGPIGQVALSGFTIPIDTAAKYSKKQRRYTLRLQRALAGPPAAISSRGSQPDLALADPLANDDVEDSPDGVSTAAVADSLGSDEEFKDAVEAVGDAAVLSSATDSTQASADEQGAKDDMQADASSDVGAGISGVESDVLKGLSKGQRKKELARLKKAAADAAGDEQAEEPQTVGIVAKPATGTAGATATAATAQAAVKELPPAAASRTNGHHEGDEADDGGDEESNAGGASAAKKKRKKSRKNAATLGAAEASTGSPPLTSIPVSSGVAAAATATSDSLNKGETSPKAAAPPATKAAPPAVALATTSLVSTEPSVPPSKRILVDLVADFHDHLVASTVLGAETLAYEPLAGPVVKGSFYKSEHKGEDKWLQAPHNTWAMSEGAGITPFSAFGVFDGHGGKETVGWIAKNLLPLVTSHLDRAKGEVASTRLPPTASEDGGLQPSEEVCAMWAAQEAMVERLPKAFHAGFVEANRECVKRFATSGTTATLAVQVGWELLVASVGDSLAYLDTGAEVLQVSANHRVAENEEEVDRIKAAGGSIGQADINGVACGPPRVWPGGLAMTRSIGDRDADQKAGVIAEPEIRQVSIPHAGARLIIASDGLWDALPAKTTIHQLRGMTAGEAASRACSWVLKKKGLKDDITVIVVDFLQTEGERAPHALAATAQHHGLAAAAAASHKALDSINMWKPLETPSGTWRDRLCHHRGQAIQFQEDTKAAIEAAEIAEKERAAEKAAAVAPAVGSPPSRTNKSIEDEYMIKVDLSALDSLEESTVTSPEDTATGSKTPDGWTTVGSKQGATASNGQDASANDSRRYSGDGRGGRQVRGGRGGREGFVGGRGGRGSYRDGESFGGRGRGGRGRDGPYRGGHPGQSSTASAAAPPSAATAVQHEAEGAESDYVMVEVPEAYSAASGGDKWDAVAAAAAAAAKAAAENALMVGRGRGVRRGGGHGAGGGRGLGRGQRQYSGDARPLEHTAPSNSASDQQQSQLADAPGARPNHFSRGRGGRGGEPRQQWQSGDSYGGRYGRGGGRSSGRYSREASAATADASGVADGAGGHASGGRGRRPRDRVAGNNGAGYAEHAHMSANNDAVPVGDFGSGFGKDYGGGFAAPVAGSAAVPAQTNQVAVSPHSGGGGEFGSAFEALPPAGAAGGLSFGSF